jgi:hypothetical protein
MSTWERNLQVAAAGVAAGALLEIVTGGQRTPLASLRQCLLAGGVALAYGQLVPAAEWGVRSGTAFARLPWVKAVESSLGGVPTLERTGWGGLTGLLLRWAQA